MNASRPLAVSTFFASLVIASCADSPADETRTASTANSADPTSTATTEITTNNDTEQTPTNSLTTDQNPTADNPTTGSEPPEHPLVEKAKSQGFVWVAIDLSTLLTVPTSFDEPAWTNYHIELDAKQQEILDSVPAGILDLVRFKHTPGLTIKADEAAARSLVDSVDPGLLSEDIPVALSMTFSAERVGAQRYQAEGFTGAGVAVAIIDTGVDAGHPAFGGRVAHEACFSPGVCPDGSSNQIGPGAAHPCPHGDCAHGTHVAGIAAGETAKWTGIAPAAQIVAIQVFHAGNDCPNGASICANPAHIIQGLEHTLDLRQNGVTIAAVNLSIGNGVLHPGPCDGIHPGFAQILALLQNAGVATVIASGNDGFTTGISWPACMSGAIAVGNVDKWDRVNSTSNSSTQVRFVAPGTDILSSVPEDEESSMSGTSMAAPHITGALAATRQQYPGASVEELVTGLQTVGLGITDSRNGVTTPRLRLRAPVFIFQRFSRQLHQTKRLVPIGTDNKIRWEHSGPYSEPIPLTDLPGQGALQSLGALVIGNNTQIFEGFWRGDEGYSRIVPLDAHGYPDYVNSGAWAGPFMLDGLPGTGSIQTQSDVIVGNGTKLVQSLWRDNQGYSRVIPMDGSGFPLFDQAGPWVGPLPINLLPGEGDMQAQSDYVLGSNLIHTFWRGDQTWARVVPLDGNGNPDDQNGGPWIGPGTLGDLETLGVPGSGPILAQSDVILTEK